MLHRVALVRTDVLEESIASIIRVIRIDDLGTTLPVTSKRSKLQRNGGDNFLLNLGSYESHTT
jgi:hypothetical protein